MADNNSSSDSDPELPGDINGVSHQDGVIIKKFWSKVKTLTKCVSSFSESPTLSPQQQPDRSTDPAQDDVFFGSSFSDSRTPTRLPISPPSKYVYDFSFRTRGVAVLIVNTNFLDPKTTPTRKYAKHDMRTFKKLLKALNFTIIELPDLTTSQLVRRLEDIRSTLVSDCDCFLCVISSHGLETRISRNTRKRHHITFTYDKWIPTDNIIRTFNESNCRALRRKPKLFFIQACRSVLGVPDELSTDKGVVHSQRTFQARPPGRRDVRDQPIMAGVINMGSINESLLADDGPNTLENDQLNPNPSSSGTSESVHQNIVHDDIPFADDDDVDSDDEDENISWGDNVPYYPPRSRYRPTNTDDVDFCTIPCYPHCLVMFSSAPERIAWSDDSIGGWLPHCMFTVLDKLIQSDFRIDLLDVLTEVNDEMSRTMQTNVPDDRTTDKAKSVACIYHMLIKDIYLTPKYPPDVVPDRVRVSAV